MAPNPFKLLPRLGQFVDGFAPCFSRKKQSDSAQRYVRGLLSDAKKKNMQCMCGRLTGDDDYQSLQHFITHSTWSAESVWAQLRMDCPDREGVLAIDDTGIAKQGKHSVGVHRQYSGTLGKVGNCQVVVSCVLRAKRLIWPLGMQLYLPEVWAEDESRRDAAAIPETVVFQTKWEIALHLVDQAIDAGIEPTCVTADAAYGECSDFRDRLTERGLAYSVGVPSDVKVFAKPPRWVEPTTNSFGRPKKRPRLAGNSPKPRTAAEIAASTPKSSWKKVTWRKGTKGPLAAEFLALRVTPSRGWHKGQKNDECWLICERPCGAKKVRKYYLSTLPRRTSLTKLALLTHERWVIEHNYRDFKHELGLDHFEGRSYPGFHRHLALTAVAYTFLETERRRSRATDLPTLNATRRSVTEILTMLLFALGERSSKIILEFIRDPPEL